MTIKVSVDVIGLRELEQALQELGSEVAGKNGGLVRTALMGAALPVLRDAQSRVPKKEGDLMRAIKRSRIKNPRAYSEIITVGVPLPEFQSGQHAVLTNKKQGGHGLFIEFGAQRPWSTKNNYGKTRADYRVGGNFMMPPRPFLRPALEGNRKNSVEIFRKNLATGIVRVAKKVGNKNAQAIGARIKKL